MALNKNTFDKKYLLGGFVLLCVGIAVGAVIGDIPFVTFKREVDLGTFIAILGLVGSLFYIPNVVQRKFVKIDNINEVIRDDIESIIKDVERLKEIYVGIKATVAVKPSTYKEILALFKSISAAILALNTELVGRDKLPDFKEDVYNQTFVTAKDACTEELIENTRLAAGVSLDAVTHLNRLCAELRKYRYKTYSER
jgi:hypothetical protein